MRVLLSIAVLAAACRAADPPPADVTRWPEVVVPMDGTSAYERFWTAANRSASEWAVAAEGGRITASARVWKRTGPPGIPVGGAEVPPALRLNGASTEFVRVTDGWLVGYNGGEWGGVVIWYSADGKANREVSRDQVNAFAETRDGVFAATTLPHAFSDAGALVRFAQKDGRWGAERVVELPGDASAAAAQADGAIVVAVGARLVLVDRVGKVVAPRVEGARLVRVDRAGKVETLVSEGEWWRLYPTSVAVGPDGRVFIGMRQFVGVFDPKEPGRGVRLRVPTKEVLRPPK